MRIGEVGLRTNNVEKLANFYKLRSFLTEE